MKFLNWLKSIPTTFWKSLEQKGKFTSILGVGIILGAVAQPLVDHNNGVVFDEKYMFQIIYFMIGGISLIILPSKIKVSKDGLEIED